MRNLEKTKKYMAVILIVSLIAAAFAGCGAQTAGKSNGTEYQDDGESDIPNAYNVAYKICINTYIYDEKTMDDPAMADLCGLFPLSKPGSYPEAL